LRAGGRFNRLKSVWLEGGTVLGVIATIPSVETVQIMARSGLDWIIIDMEHGAIDAGAAHAMIAATTGSLLVPLVRVPSTTPSEAKLPLDMGAMGVCFPMTTTRADAEAVVRAVRYPPTGERFWGPFYAPPRWGVSMRDYLDCSDDEVLAIGTIEHIDAIGSIRNSPVILGGVATTPTQANDMIARGYRALVVGFEWSLLQRGIDAAIQGIR
jgi:4-hydroxy-2-oxoheptanedioate aldolase